MVNNEYYNAPATTGMYSCLTRNKANNPAVIRLLKMGKNVSWYATPSLTTEHFSYNCSVIMSDRESILRPI